MTSIQNEDIHVLISAFLSGNATEKEVAELEKWVDSSGENRKYFLHLKNIWDLTGRELGPDDIKTDRALLDIQKNIKAHMRRSVFISVFQKAAAILLLPLLAFSLWLAGSQYFNEFKKNPVYCEVSAAFGTRSVITLSDSSKIWLNSGSTLKYPQQFTGHTREVYLNGEGYFEVDANGKKPFIVHTGRLDIKATGTKFNINASGLDHYTTVTLVSGKVTVNAGGNGKVSSELAKMTANQHLAYDTISGTFNLTDEDTYRHIAWKDGKLIFRNEPLEDVLRKIGYFYNVDMVILDSRLKEYRYRATFEEESIEEIMNLLKLSSPLDYKVEVRKPLPDGSFPKKKIIIFPVKK